MFSLICVWINGWVNNREAGDLRPHRGHYDVNVMVRQHWMFRWWVAKQLGAYKAMFGKLCIMPLHIHMFWCYRFSIASAVELQERHCVSNNRHLSCLVSSESRLKTKQTSKLRLREGNNGWIPHTKAPVIRKAFSRHDAIMIETCPHASGFLEPP